MRTILLAGVVLLLLATGGMQIVSLHRTNAQLRVQLDERRIRENRTLVAGPAISRRPAIVGDQGPRPATANETTVCLTRLREEVAAAEKRAVEQYAANSEAIEETSTNRNPEKGMARLENFQNVGQASPAAALQTLFWATLKGDEQVMSRTIGWDESVRPQVQALIDNLPESSRARFSTPEQLAALFISKYALDVSAIHISEIAMKDSTNASLTVEGLVPEAQHLPMHLGPDGWQLQTGEGTLKALSKELLGKK
jgi:hypothetical protein